MLAESCDVAIIGGGYVGLAAAYHLARRGAHVRLLERYSLGSGASGANAGRAQVSESHPGPDLDLALAGLSRLESLEEELGFSFEWRRLGNLMLIEREEHWRWWNAQIAHLQARGIPAAMLDLQALRDAEPLLQSERFRGAAWCLEGHLNPFKFCQAWARAARQRGAELSLHTPILGFERTGARITALVTPWGRVSAGAVLVAAGAATGQLLQLAGASLPVQFTHAEAVISEPLPPLLHHHIGLADFYETIHNARRAVSIGVAQQMAGTLLITEAVEMTPVIHHANSAWGIPAIARDLLALFPALATVRLVRAWAAPSPFLPDETPAIGAVPGYDNLFVATCLHLTITTVAVLADQLAALLLRESNGGEGGALAAFDPARFNAHHTASRS